MTGLHSKTVIWRKNLWNTTNCRYHLLMPPPRPHRKWVEAQKGNICCQHYYLTLIDMRGDTFDSLSFFGQILSAEFLSKLFTPCPFWIRFCLLIFYQTFPNFFGGENWRQSYWFDRVALKMSIILAFIAHANKGQK